MKKWMMPIGLIVVICILAASVAMPICLADQNRIEIEGRLDEPSSDVTLLNIHDHYKLGNLHKGDRVEVVMTSLRGDGDVSVNLVKNISIFSQLSEFFYRLGSCPPCGGLLSCLGTWADNFHGTALLAQGLSSPGEQYVMISNTGEEKILDVPSDGMWYIELNTENGNVRYEGYIEVIKAEK
jgi:hypothetical protein